MHRINQIARRAVVAALAMLVAAGCVFNAGTTYSWFAFSDAKLAAVDAGKVSYRPNPQNTDAADATNYGEFIPDTKEGDDTSYIYPGRELVKEPLKLRNLSSIETDVRVRITGTISDNNPTAGTEPQKQNLLLGSERTTAGAFQLGMNCAPADGGAFIPLLVVLFSDSPSGSYTWRPAAVPLAAGGLEWELAFAAGGGADTAVPTPPEGGTIYTTVTSAAVIASLPTDREEELFTKMYSNKKLTLTVEYLAKQHEGMDWTVFYKEVFNE